MRSSRPESASHAASTGLDVLVAFFIEPKPQGSSFELSFEIRDRLDHSTDCSCDLFEVRLGVGGRLKRAHFVPTFSRPRGAFCVFDGQARNSPEIGTVLRSLGSDGGRALRTFGEAIKLDTAEPAHELRGTGWRSKQKTRRLLPTGEHSTPSINFGSLLLWS